MLLIIGFSWSCSDNGFIKRNTGKQWDRESSHCWFKDFPQLELGQGWKQDLGMQSRWSTWMIGMQLLRSGAEYWTSSISMWDVSLNQRLNLWAKRLPPKTFWNAFMLVFHCELFLMIAAAEDFLAFLIAVCISSLWKEWWAEFLFLVWFIKIFFYSYCFCYPKKYLSVLCHEDILSLECFLLKIIYL